MCKEYARLICKICRICKQICNKICTKYDIKYATNRQICKKICRTICKICHIKKHFKFIPKYAKYATKMQNM